jgi:hypothetical protein
MVWAVSLGVLVSVAVILRRTLRMNQPDSAPRGSYILLSREREALFQPLAQEVEVRSAILAITLNDAFEEHDAARLECAWRLLDLVAGELAGLAELNGALHHLWSRYLPAVQNVVPLRHLDSKHFRSNLMNDYSRLHEVLGEFVFPSKLRFQFHLRVLRQAADALAADLRAAHSQKDGNGSEFREMWRRMEADLHDFDLVVKETLLSFRSFLSGLAEAELANFSADLESLPGQGQRSAPLASRFNEN